MGNKITVNITEEILTFVKLFHITKFSENRIGIDNYALFNESHPFELMARVLGLEDKIIEGTEENPLGAEYEKETMDKLIELDSYIVDNLTNIEEILHQFCDVGIKPGKYTCLSYQHIWKYEGE
jgi:hypothetical protein